MCCKIKTCKLFCCSSLFHLSHTYKSSKKSIPTNSQCLTASQANGLSWLLLPQKKMKQTLTSCQESGSLPAVALGTCKKEIQTCWTTTSPHQLSSQTATVPFPNLPGFQQNTARFPVVAPAMTLKTLMSCWGHWLTNSLWQLKASLPQTLLSVPLPKVSIPIEMWPEGPTLNVI